MKTKLIGIIVFSILFLSFYFVKAQENSQGITFSDSSATQQPHNEIQIKFRIKNNGNIKTGIKYGVELLNEKNVVIDKKTYDESATLLSEKEIEKEILYVAPEYLNGKYSVILSVSNENGSYLGLTFIGSVSLLGNNQFIEIENESCYLAVEKENPEKKYTLDQGVDVMSSENLLINCNATNHFDENITFSPVFKTYKRSIYGENISEKQEDLKQSFSLLPKEKKSLSFTVQKVFIPQSYDTVLSFSNGEKLISNEIIFHYVMSGRSANILDLSIDKDFYKSGENANVSFFLTGSADSFPDSRLGGGRLENVAVELSMLNSENKKCIEPIKNEFKGGKNDLLVGIIENCQNPLVEVKVKDSDGNILGESKINVESKSVSKNKNTMFFENNKKIGLALAVLLPIIVLVFFGIKKLRKKTIPPIIALFISLGAAILFGFLKTDNAQAYGAPNLISPSNKVYLQGEEEFKWSRPSGFTPSENNSWYRLIIEKNGAIFANVMPIYSESFKYDLSSFRENGEYSWSVLAEQGYFVSENCVTSWYDYYGNYETKNCSELPSGTIRHNCSGSDEYGNNYYYFPDCCNYELQFNYDFGTVYKKIESNCFIYSPAQLITTSTKTSSSRNFYRYSTQPVSGPISFVACADGDCENGDSYYASVPKNVVSPPDDLIIYAYVGYIGCHNGGGWNGAFYQLETSDGKPIPGLESYYKYQSFWNYQTINIPPSVSPGTYNVAFKLHGHYDLNSYRYYYMQFTVLDTAKPPIVEAGGPYEIEPGGSVQLTGSAISGKADDKLLSTEWSCDRGMTFSCEDPSISAAPTLYSYHFNSWESSDTNDPENSEFNYRDSTKRLCCDKTFDNKHECWSLINGSDIVQPYIGDKAYDVMQSNSSLFWGATFKSQGQSNKMSIDNVLSPYFQLSGSESVGEQITCTLKAGSQDNAGVNHFSSDVAIINVVAPVVSVDLKPDEQTVCTNSFQTLQWTSENATSCSSSDFTGVDGATSGNASVDVGFVGNKNYTISCTNGSSATLDTTTFNVVADISFFQEVLNCISDVCRKEKIKCNSCNESIPVDDSKCAGKNEGDSCKVDTNWREVAP